MMVGEINKLESEIAYDKIVELLLKESISSELFVSERSLSNLLGLGRTPIREAIRDLVREGVLESHPTRGTLVRPPSVTDLQDLYEIRSAIEGLAVKLVAERGAVQELEPFAAEFDGVLRSAEDFDIVKVHDHGVTFHEAIVRLSGNKRLIELYRPFRLRFRIPFAMVRHKTPERVRAAVAEHQTLLTAIMRRDGTQAQLLIQEHLNHGLKFRVGLLINRYRKPNAG
jgi:DNA-binding GntR family transcriptional regulator